jgi:hypothetical protein
MSDKEISSGYQFIHVDYTARSPGKTQKTFKSKVGIEQRATGWTPFDILAEVTRFPGHHPHVPHPRPPLTVFGHEDPFEVLKDIDAWVEHREQVDGKKYGKNKPVMVNGVVSFPDERGDEDWLAFRDRSIEWLRRKYGDGLRCVVEHGDESHPHVHFYVVPTFGVDAEGKPWASDFASIHQGYAARNGVRSANAKEKGSWHAGGAKTMSAFTNAMKAYQDEFQLEVGRFHGLGRKGPARVRLPHNLAVELSRSRLKLADDLVAAEKSERDAREAERLRQAELFTAAQLRAEAERHAGEIMAAAEQKQHEFEEWKRRQRAEFDRREQALEAERIRLAEVEREAIAAARQKDAEIFFLKDTNKALVAENKSLREQLAEIRSDIVRVLKHVGKLAVGPFWRIYDKYIGKGSSGDDSIAAGQGGLKSGTKPSPWKS